jgi:RNA polymerase sigma-70 factor (ECF subfamily)
MVEESASLEQLVARLERGEDDAWTRLYDLYARRLLTLARMRLQGIQQKVGADDVLQSVFRSFFLRCADRRFDLKSWENLWGLLVVITLRKCNRQLRHFHADRRDLRQELAQPMGDSSSQAHELTVIAHDPTPEEVSRLLETIEEMMRDLDERERRIVELRLQEYTLQEISDRVGRTERTVQRVLQRVRKRLERMRVEE